MVQKEQIDSMKSKSASAAAAKDDRSLQDLSRSPDFSVAEGLPRRTTTSVCSAFSEDVWTQILLFLSYEEACQVCRHSGLPVISSPTTATTTTRRFSALWRAIFLRRGFSEQPATASVDPHPALEGHDGGALSFFHKNEYVTRCRLLRQLCGGRTSDGPYSSCSLALPPNSKTFFVPRSVLCDSSDFLRRHRRRQSTSSVTSLFDFQLTSTSVGSELLVLDRNNRGATTVALWKNLRSPLAPGDVTAGGYSSLALPELVPLEDGDEMRGCRSILYTSQQQQDVVANVRLLPTVYSSRDKTAMFGVASELVTEGITECRFWSRNDGGGSDAFSLLTCRVPVRKSRLMDFSARHGMVYVVASRSADGTEEEEGSTATTSQATISSSRLEAYRMEASSSSRVRSGKHLSELTLSVDCGEPILALSVSPAGDKLLVATLRHLHVYDVRSQNASARLMDTISFHSAVENAFEGLRNDVFVKALFGDRTGDPTAAGVSIHVPRHLPLEIAGFATLQTQAYQTVNRIFGNHTIYLWERTTTIARDETTWSVYAMINLPLVLRKRPQVHYDGNRLVVFGQDHIGLIVLIYEVRSTLESQVSVAAAAANQASRQDGLLGKEASGGVYNFGSKSGSLPRVRFANRFRHVALGGLDSTEGLQMTCNERLVVLRTKHGSRLEDQGSSNDDDGLLVIDLLDEDAHSVL